MHLDPNTAGSWLEDLPVTRARNNYSQVVNGKVEILPTEISRDKHIFPFPFFSLDHEHVQKINMICFEQAAGMKTIVYKSPDNLRTALDYYLTDKTLGFKQVYPPPPDDPRYLHMVLQEDGQIRLQTEDKMLPYLQLLHKFARQLGSSVELEYNLMNPAQTILVPAMTVEQKARYEKLGGFSWVVIQYNLVAKCERRHFSIFSPRLRSSKTNCSLGAEELQALKDVFFQTLYQSEFGGRMRG